MQSRRHSLIEAAELREIVRYDAETGVFRWRETRCGRALQGNVIGSRTSEGYLSVEIGGMAYKLHRLAWLYVYGKWPRGFIDHANGIRDDNRISNLREASHKQNKANSRRQSNNTSGFKGVSFHRRANKWSAYIRVDGNLRHLGYFETPEAAHEKYKSAARAVFGDYARHA